MTYLNSVQKSSKSENYKKKTKAELLEDLKAARTHAIYVDGLLNIVIDLLRESSDEVAKNLSKALSSRNIDEDIKNYSQRIDKTLAALYTLEESLNNPNISLDVSKKFIQSVLLLHSQDR